MKRIKLIISYDGTNYVGWQIQKNGIAIEQVINEELSRLLKEDITIIGASRTDSGVHALGNVAVFDTNTRIPPEKIMYALNQQL
ncbi:MAG: tRNA pseudouridine(38-40) synthase TruA, partial [Lachnospiraceae bacterium]|nr:tRNA pseudouridine(38-40) synthase TruA [Lachnospiraceae bacterium]